MKAEHQAYLDKYLQSLPTEASKKMAPVVAEYFCGDEWNANECARLVLEGTKTATCSLKVAYELEGENLPQVGQLMVVLNWDEDPVCIIETSSIEHRPFNAVSEEFAFAEGEGDRSYLSWHSSHSQFFQSVCDELNIVWSEDRELVCERFKVVFRSDGSE